MRKPRASPTLIELLGNFQASRIVVEVGTYRGLMAETLLEAFPDLLLTMVDPWTVHDHDSEYYRSGDPMARMTADEWEAIHDEAVLRTDRFKDRRSIRRMTSSEASKTFADLDVDLVFIDAEHTHQAVTQDIGLWWPKVRSGGILAGHDYHRSCPGVIQAVNEWTPRVGLQLNRGGGRTWWVRKPRT